MADLTDDERVLVHLFNDGHHRNVVALARALCMEQDAVKHHLDRLAEAKLAHLMIAQGHLYWGITIEGRRYVMERGLIQDANLKCCLNPSATRSPAGGPIWTRNCVLPSSETVGSGFKVHD
jgi:hypothetical protein